MRLSFALLLSFAGCFHPDIGDATIFCSPDTPPRCPNGFSCGFDGLCYKHPPTKSPYGDGSLPELDMLDKMGVLLLHTDNARITFIDATTNMETDVITPPDPVPLYEQTDGPPFTVWSFKRLTVGVGVTLRVSPDSRAIPVLSGTGDIHQTPGPTLELLCPIDLAGLGGQNGANNQAGTLAPGSAQPGGLGADMNSNGGGGGGGDQDNGGDGTGTGAGKGGSSVSMINPDLVTFGQGGGGGGQTATEDVAGFGGNGGGALVLLGYWVQVNSSVNLSGLSGGQGRGGNGGGGGGGAGGTLLISGDRVVLGDNLVVNVTGGDGGKGAGTGGSGGKGSPGRIRIHATNQDFNNAVTYVPMGSESGTNMALTDFPPPPPK
jgi:hypothetical protein